MPKVEIAQCDDVLDDILEECKDDKALLAEVMDALQELREHGRGLGMPTSEHLEDGIFQLRAKTHNRQARLLYFLNPDFSKATLVYTFIKKTRATPRKAIEMAKRRRQALQEQGGG